MSAFSFLDLPDELRDEISARIFAEEVVIDKYYRLPKTLTSCHSIWPESAGQYHATAPSSQGVDELSAVAWLAHLTVRQVSSIRMLKYYNRQTINQKFKEGSHLCKCILYQKPFKFGEEVRNSEMVIGFHC